MPADPAPRRADAGAVNQIADVEEIAGSGGRCIDHHCRCRLKILLLPVVSVVLATTRTDCDVVWKPVVMLAPANSPSRVS